MSKKKAKKGRVVAKKAPKKTAAKKVVKKASARRMTSSSVAEPARGPRTKTANIFLFKTDAGVKIRTTPQRLYANPGDSVEFNVVNMIDGSDVDVTIQFPEGGPWGDKPFTIRSWERKGLGSPVEGRFKYVVRALGAEEDPEVELPDGPP